MKLNRFNIIKQNLKTWFAITKVTKINYNFYF